MCHATTVSVLDPSSAAVIADIPLPAMLCYLAINPDGSRLYAANADYDGTNGRVSVIDTATHTIVDSVDIGGAPYFPAVSPDGTRLYVASYPGTNIAVVETAGNTVVETFDVGAIPGFLVATDTKLYTASVTLGQTPTVDDVIAIDTASGAIAASIPVPQQFNKLGPYAAVSPDGGHLYVAVAGAAMTGQLMVIDTATDTVAGSVDVPSPRWVTVSPNGSTVYVTNFWEGSVSVLTKTYVWKPPHLPEIVGHLIGGVANGGGGWLVIGDHFYKIPPRPLALFAIARAAAPFLSKPIANRKLGQQLRKLDESQSHSQLHP